MTSKLNKLVARLTDPRKLILLAALLAAMGLIAGYVQVQFEVDRTLALRQGPPPTVTLQDYRASRDTGPAREVQVFAEADFGKAVILRQRGSKPERRVLAVPLLEVSEMGATLIDTTTDRNKAALSAQVSRRAMAPEPEQAPTALGVMMHGLFPGEVAPDPRDLAKNIFGQGRHGSVVRINGSRIRNHEMLPMVDGAFMALGLDLSDEMLAIAPFAEGRMAYLTAPIEAKSHKWVYVLAAILAISALILSLRGTIRDRDRLRASMLDDDVADQAEPSQRSVHPKFAPIPSQEELSAKLQEDGEDDSELPASRLRALIHFVMRRLEARRTS